MLGTKKIIKCIEDAIDELTKDVNSYRLLVKSELIYLPVRRTP